MVMEVNRHFGCYLLWKMFELEDVLDLVLVGRQTE